MTTQLQLINIIIIMSPNSFWNDKYLESFYSKSKHKFHVKYIPSSKNTAKPVKLHTMGINMAQRSYELHGR